MPGNIIAGAPTAANHVATKQYVDDNAGAGGLSSQTLVSAKRTVDLTDIQWATATRVPFNEEAEDTEDELDAPTGIFTAKEAGVYSVSYGVQFRQETLITGQDYHCHLRVNGIQNVGIQPVYVMKAGFNQHHPGVTGSQIVILEAGHTIELITDHAA